LTGSVAPQVHDEKNAVTGACERNEPYPSEQGYTLGPEVALVEGTSRIEADGAIGLKVYTSGGPALSAGCGTRRATSRAPSGPPSRQVA